jgi:hypothetical protein
MGGHGTEVEVRSTN